MEWYIITGLIIIILAILVFKNTNVAVSLLVENIMKILSDSEPFIVQGVYNILPKELKASVKSEHVAMVISYAIVMIGKLLKEDKY